MGKEIKSKSEREYVLGTNDGELSRLGLQHQLWSEQTARAWERAGFVSGQTLLDVGCGPGYATFDLARLVGERGEVIGIDQSQRFIDQLDSQVRAQGARNIATRLSDVEKIKLPRASVDGAFARWLLCFVKNPETVIAGVARALKRGGTFVVLDYFNYEAVTIAPRHEIFRRFFRAVAESWRQRGGDPDVGCKIPTLMNRHGLEVREINSVVRIARPGSQFWQWPATFFDNYLPALMEMGLFNQADVRLFRREWKKRAHDPAAFFASPPMVEIIAVKR